MPAMTTTTSVSPCRILIYGRDEVLLDTRSALLRTAGFESDVTIDGEKFVRHLTALKHRYCIFIVCHSINVREAEALVEAGNDSGVGVYALSWMVMPLEFLKEVRRLADMCSIASTPLSA